MQKILTPNVMQFLGGAVSVLIGALVLKQDANGALVNLDKAVTRRNGDWRPLVLQGIVLQDLGREDEARVCFATALDEQPTLADARRLQQAIDERSRLSSVPDSGE